jgi:2-(1,2-epoxy-1,2-dihydrophenyl)acetyl-CoA isomerase
VLEIENAGRVRVLRLNRPERKNALSSELGSAIVSALEDAARDDDVWVIGEAMNAFLERRPAH